MQSCKKKFGKQIKNKTTIFAIKMKKASIYYHSRNVQENILYYNNWPMTD